jgi:hypothetical protein
MLITNLAPKCGPCKLIAWTRGDDPDISIEISFKAATKLQGEDPVPTFARSLVAFQSGVNPEGSMILTFTITNSHFSAA